ncbi:acyltransferase [Dyella sp. EPa41]|uniref:acyltransferase family protein n=1 Tax=Dyella sp. EPa41 TaxID=1561194 RepID=UPI0019152855|nr:acyltransferase [Dyella sp. EPa41]
MACTKELRFEWMDALRGAAAILVLIRHYFRIAALGPLATHIDPGTMGVVAFFCISGYIIPWSVLHSPTTVLQFATARAFRLYPAYWVSLILAVVAAPVALPVLLANMTMAQRFMGVHDIVGVYWTLQIEIIFYAVMAVLMLAGKVADPRASLWCLLGACVLSLLLAIPRAVLLVKTPVAPAFSLVVMFASFVFYHHRHAGFLSSTRLRCILSGVGAVMVGCFLLAYHRDWGFGETPLRFVLGYAVGVGLFMAFMRLDIRMPALCWLGSISYPLYLIHVPVREIIVGLMPSLGEIPSALLGIPATVALAAVIHHGVELPFNRLGKRWVARYRVQRLKGAPDAVPLD